MQIACPQCSTRYELDDRLLPPSGAPVQCTRCSHVFNAVPPRGEDADLDDAPPAATPGDRTQIFGRAGGQDPSADRAPAESAAESEPTEGTQLYGRTPPRSTQMFGAVPPPTRADSRATQTFGAVSPPDVRSTQVSGLSAPPAGVPSTTQIFGAGPAPSTPASTDVRSTMIFGAAPAPAASDVRSTQVYGTPVPQARPTATPAYGTRTASRPELPATPEAAPEPQAESTSPLGGRRRTGTVPAAVLQPFDPPPIERPALGDEPDPAVALETALRRRRSMTFAVIGGIAVVVVGVLGFQAWSSRPVALPSEAHDAHQKALTLVRRDDPKSLEEAVKQLEEVLQRWPAHHEARATHLIALTFRLDDARMEIDRLNSASEALNAQIRKLKERKSPSDWQNRVNALIGQLESLKKRSDPLIDGASALDAKVNAAFRELHAKLGSSRPEEELSLVRAQAVYSGVKGSDEAIRLSERYRQLGGIDGWGDLAYAEYALNARVAPETRRQAIAALEALRGKDASFVRPWMLAARLSLQNKSPTAAATALESVTTLNPEHALARDLLKDAEKARADQASDL